MRDTTFIIQIPKLSEGKNLFGWKVDERYFIDRPHSFIRNGLLELSLEVDKNIHVLDFQFSLNGWVEMVCDRCTDPVKVPVSNQSLLIVKLLEEGGESDDQVIYLGRHDNEVNLEEVIYDLIMTSVPMRVLCEMEVPPKACNAEVLSNLEKIKLNSLSEDERWEALKKFKTDSNT